MNNVLILFAHPRFEQSRSNKILVDAIKGMEGVTLHDLYERYPDFNIDIFIEKDLLKHHDVIVWHHPFYWYSSPPLLKQWIDMVLEFGWAYGPNGDALKGKRCLNVITTGGSREVYHEEGRNRYTVREFLRPFEQTARLCGMNYLPPFAVMGTHKLTEEVLVEHGEKYRMLIQKLREDSSFDTALESDFLNDLPEIKSASSS
jgi:glutathione-regulated potassium-efflux system ancillary protein KefG